MISWYLSSFLPTERYARLRLPFSGSLGSRFPTFSVNIPDHRYYAPLRLPFARLGSLRFSLSFPNTLSCSRSFVSRFRLVIWVGSHPMTPRLLVSQYPCSSGAPGGRQMALPSSRVVPLNVCPALRPRWCPASSPFRFQDCCLPFRQQRRLSPVLFWLSLVHHHILFRGSITRPAFLFHPVPYFHCWFCTWVSLLTCWLDFDQMGFELRREYSTRTHWTTLTNFKDLL